MSLVRGAAYAAVFMAGQGCTLGHLFRFSEEGPLLCRLRSSLSLFQNFQLKGPVSEATDLNFKPIYNWGRRGW